MQTRTDDDYEKDLSNTKFASRKQSSVNKDLANHEVAVKISVAGQDEIDLTESHFLFWRPFCFLQKKLQDDEFLAKILVSIKSQS